MLEVHDSAAHDQRRLPRSALQVRHGEISLVVRSRLVEDSVDAREVDVRRMVRPEVERGENML